MITSKNPIALPKSGVDKNVEKSPWKMRCRKRELFQPGKDIQKMNMDKMDKKKEVRMSKKKDPFAD